MPSATKLDPPTMKFTVAPGAIAPAHSMSRYASMSSLFCPGSLLTTVNVGSFFFKPKIDRNDCTSLSVTLLRASTATVCPVPSMPAVNSGLLLKIVAASPGPT